MTFATMGHQAVLQACLHTLPGSSAAARGGEGTSEHAPCGDCLPSWTHVPASAVCSCRGPLPLESSYWDPAVGRHLTCSLTCRNARPCHFFNTPQVRPPVDFAMSCLWLGTTASQTCCNHAVDMQGCKKGDACPFEHVPAEGASLNSRQNEFNSRPPQRCGVPVHAYCCVSCPFLRPV